jgi:hypothetical protein
MRNSTTDRKPGNDFGGGIVEVGSRGEGLGLLGWSKDTFYQKTFGMCC